MPIYSEDGRDWERRVVETVEV